MPRLKDKFKSEIIPAMKKEFGIDNIMALPKIDKVLINVGMGKQLEGTKLNVKAKNQVLSDLTQISGQRPVMTKAKKSVSNFKVRAGYETGVMVTMRGDRMWEFLDRMISLAIPRIKDFRGLNSKSFDGRGNYSFGLTEQGVFPEINMAQSEFTHGMNISIVFKNSDNAKSLMVLKALDIPFAGKDDKRL